MRIALLSYRSKTHCGGQGVYVRHLSRGLAELGHDVEVFSGQPYPEGLDRRVRLTKVPSLDLYREPDPFRVPRPSEIRDGIDALELLTMWTAGFPEPRTFTLRAARMLAERLDDFDVVHDNQSLGTGLLKIEKLGLPVVATVHHPITRDRVVEVAAAKWWRKPLVRRWYGFAEMQKRVARRIPELLTVSSSSAADIADDFRVSPDQLHVVPLGVNTELFKPAEHRVSGRIIAIASADVPLKGISHLLHAVARLRVERNLDVQLVSKLEPNGPTEKLIAELGISDIVHSSTGCPTKRWPACWPRPRWRAFRRSTKGFHCPRSRRWPAVPRSWPAAPERCPRWSAPMAGARGWYARQMSTNSPRYSVNCSTHRWSARSWDRPAGNVRSTSSAGNRLPHRRCPYTNKPVQDAVHVRSDEVTHADRRL